MLPPEEALQRLREGNERFARGTGGKLKAQSRGLRDLIAGQDPMSIVLGCSDSRVPVELVFDQGPGDLFVIRVAGNIAAPSQVASVEFAAETFGTRLVVVLGHTRCGAVLAVLDDMQRPDEERSSVYGPVLDEVRMAIESVAGQCTEPAEAVRANVRGAAERLRASEVLNRLARDDGLLVVGAEYSLETGAVEFFDGVDG